MAPDGVGLDGRGRHQGSSAIIPVEAPSAQPTSAWVCSGTVARSLNHNYVGTEHLLLGLLVEGQGVAAKVLLERGLTHQAVEAAAVMVSPRGDRTVAGDLPFNPRAMTSFTGAVTAAIELGHNCVGTEHLLLALMRDPDGLAAKILAANNITAEEVRGRVAELLGETGASNWRSGRTRSRRRRDHLR